MTIKKYSKRNKQSRVEKVNGFWRGWRKLTMEQQEFVQADVCEKMNISDRTFYRIRTYGIGRNKKEERRGIVESAFALFGITEIWD